MSDWKAAALACLIVCGASSAAYAQMRRPPRLSLGFQAGACVITGGACQGELDPGIGWKARGGYEFSSGIAPELAASFATWSRLDSVMESNLTELSLLAGLRWT